ncbi:MAG: glutamate-5-semialdehyde dehydrogenase [Bacteroidaceae bacterium]|nr:glutamate-5-semialdehyde dehydrogenase [Bacteroidaceae bacterium]
MQTVFSNAKRAAYELAALDDRTRSTLLQDLSEAIKANTATILEANAKDLARMDQSNPLYDRLQLTESRLQAISADMLAVSQLPCPLDRVLEDRVLPNGLRLRKVSVPYGLVGVIYEARPNVTFDVFSICVKSGNGCILKGGKDAQDTNEASIALIKKVLADHNMNPDTVTLLPATHEAAAELLNATGYVDMVIPRGSRRLIDFVRDNAKVPCIETGAGVVNTYFDKEGDLELGRRIVMNAKTRRVSVCNALDCLIIHSSRLSDLASLCEPLATKNVEILADERAYQALDGKYTMLKHATSDTFGTEFMDYRMAIRTVDSLDEALEHIGRYGSGHSESIVSANQQTAIRFQQRVDAACVYVNAPTSFTDGAQFGLGAEIGISTQKLGARGPMGLQEMNTYKWLIDGNGQIRP